MLNLQKTVLEIINEYIDDTEVTVNQFDDSLVDLGMDSIMFIRIVVALEEIFDIEIPDEKLLITEMDTINKVIGLITSLIGNSSN